MRNCSKTDGAKLLFWLGILGLAGCLDEASQSTSAEGPSGPVDLSGNSAPMITGSPQDVVLIGQNYSFIPDATDPDGDDLVFSVANQPDWANFSTVTGELSGTPTLGAVGRFDQIAISVSDGSYNSSLPEFAIEVVQVANGTVELFLTAPTTNSDGSPLTDLAGFKIYYGISQGNYPNVVRFDNPSVSNVVVDNLTMTDHFFVATAFNSSGYESNFSNAISRTPR